MNGIRELYREVASYGQLSAEYVEKQLHPVPLVKAVNRVAYLTNEARDKVIFDFGATGPLPELLRGVAKLYYSTDILPANAENYYQIDLDRADRLPDIPGLQLAIAGEVIEHLSNAGHFLDLLHTLKVPVILTAPNAFSAGSRHFLNRNIENVNREHVAWYSYHTLKVLVERHNFKLVKWHWYNGKPLTAEGIIFKLEPVDGAD
jgi:hypothetical protein